MLRRDSSLCLLVAVGSRDYRLEAQKQIKMGCVVGEV